MGKIMTIKIAPDLDEINVTDSAISTDWNGGISYNCDTTRLRGVYTEQALKCAFQQAIALSSKHWQVERLLNDYFRIEGKIS